jgi:hypothetical protein
MSLSEAFNSNYRAYKENDSVLRIEFGYVRTYYDFLGRAMVTTEWSKGGLTTTPFSQVDRDTLIAMRDKLIELKGNPPELPPEAPSVQATAKKFNL